MSYASARRSLKVGALRLLDRFGAASAVRRSRWRGESLAILCYHGVSLDDEHRWRPSLYMRPELFESRLDLLEANHYNVLPLGEGLVRLRAGTLPPRAVAITFDDGTVDFAMRAWPLLKARGYSATVYWTTHYAKREMPVPTVFSSYVQYRAGIPFAAEAQMLDHRVSSRQKNEAIQQYCREHGVNYGALCARRILQVLRPDEIHALSAEGADIQLHTHAHRVALKHEDFVADLETNRSLIRHATGKEPVHFCYPSGRFRRRLFPWLAGMGIQSATTTEPGLARPATHPYLLPRLVDHEGLSAVEVDAWLSGVAALLPHRTYWRDPDESVQPPAAPESGRS